MQKVKCNVFALPGCAIMHKVVIMIALCKMQNTKCNVFVLPGCVIMHKATQCTWCDIGCYVVLSVLKCNSIDVNAIHNTLSYSVCEGLY